MKVIVTGGCGFIGSHVVERLLADGHRVTVLDNLSTGRLENIEHIKNQVEFIEADISYPGKWQSYFNEVDWVVHLAALADIVPSIQNPSAYFLSNVNGTYHVLEAARAHGIKRFIYAASGSGYGIPEIYPTPETAPIAPQYPYALTKRLGEELVLHWAGLYKLPAISLRFFNVYGPRSRTSGVYGAMFGVFLAQKLHHKPFTVVGDGTQTRDFTYVTDVAEAVLISLKSHQTADFYNVASGNTVSINQVVELLGGDKVFIPKRPGEPDQTWGDISKIKRDLGWEPKINIQKGVAELLKNIDYWKNAPVWDPQSIQKATQDWFKYLS